MTLIRAVTGTPGAGKSNLFVSMLKRDKSYKNRPVYHHGIHWKPGHDPGKRIYCNASACMVCRSDPEGRAQGLQVSDWYQYCEPNAILFVDEAHHAFPQRNNKTETPQCITEFRESRHMAVDVLIATQHPMFMDVDIRRVVNEHIHMTKHVLGRKKKVFAEFQSSPEGAYGETSNCPFDKKAFDWYVTAEGGDTGTKKSVPKKVYYLFAASALLIGFGIYNAVGFFEGGRLNIGQTTRPEVAANDILETTTSGVPSFSAGNSNSISDLSAFDNGQFGVITNDKPQLPEYPETALMYQHLYDQLAPQSLPELSACMAQEFRCECYDQHGYKYKTSQRRCRAFIQETERPRNPSRLVQASPSSPYTPPPTSPPG